MNESIQNLVFPTVDLSESVCPIDLRELAAEHGYRYAWDESYDPANVPHDTRDTWYVRVVGKYGDIWPHSPSSGLLGVFTTQRIGRRVLAEVPGSAIYTDGDDGLMITFPIPAFATVAGIIQCYRKRVLTDEQKAALAERGKASRFGRDGTQGQFPERQHAESEPDGHPAA
jgi:hypothetical protein